MQEIIVDVSISTDEYLAYYQGTAQHIFAHAIDGRRVRFPANILQPFLTHSGIHGVFALVYDQNNKFVKVKKL